MQYLISSTDLDPNAIPQISISPEWMTMLPVLPLRINIRVLETAPLPQPGAILETTPQPLPEVTVEALPE
jgi:hypothetical protein